jgi:3-hydroxyacyl-CoA dehydrogenase/enoyl-CoA hydratase/3-hydroxybutyryl-CoA epimerase
VPAAKKWILANKDNEDAATEPVGSQGLQDARWHPEVPGAGGFLPAFPAMLRKQLKGADYPAPKAILSAAVEGAQVDFDTASRIESRYLTNLITGSEGQEHDPGLLLRPAGDQWRRAAPAGRGEVQGYEGRRARRRHDGRRHRLFCARRAWTSSSRTSRWRTPTRARPIREAARQGDLSAASSTEEKKAELLAGSPRRLTRRTSPGCDLVIEAVFEDPSLKAQVFAEIHAVRQCRRAAVLQHLHPADHRARQGRRTGRRKDFIGLHFFSPVDKMPLVEIIKGKETSDEALAKALRRRTADPQDADRGQRQPWLLHLAGHRLHGQRGHGDAGRGCAPDTPSSALPPRPAIPSAPAAVRRAQHGAHGQDRQGDPRGRRA